ncbi:MAG: HD-GYP domain-containing protein [Planctomycetota bacterium]
MIELQKMGVSSVVERDPHETVFEIKRKLLGRLVSMEELGCGDKELRVNLYDGRGRFLFSAGTPLTDDFLDKLKKNHEDNIYVLQSPDPTMVEWVRKFASVQGGEGKVTERDAATINLAINQLETADAGALDVGRLNKEESFSDPVPALPSFKSQCWTQERHVGMEEVSRLRESANLITFKVHDSIRRHEKVDVKPLKGAMDRILLAIIQDGPSSTRQCRIDGEGEKAYLCSHALNATTYASLMASEMGLSMSQVADVAASAFLSNVGALWIKDELASKPKLSSEDRVEMRRSSSHGIDVLKDFRWLPACVPYVAYQFRERLDGSGYPRKRKFIHPYARIVGVADAYDAMISDRPYRKALLPYHAMETIIHETSRGKFDRQCTKAFLKSLSLFPIGSLVELEGGKVGWVIRSNPEAIDRPVVKVVREGADNLSQPYVVDTMKSGRVSKPLDPKSFANLPA